MRVAVYRNSAGGSAYVSGKPRQARPYVVAEIDRDNYCIRMGITRPNQQPELGFWPGLEFF